MASDSFSNAVCADMQPICTADGLSFPAATNAGRAERGNRYGCLRSAPNPAWYYMKMDEPGRIVMSLTARSDIDFAVWGPYADVDAAKASCGRLPNPTDCSYSSTRFETPEIPRTAVRGEVYVLLFTNFANRVQQMSLAKTGGLGTTDCTAMA